MANKVTVHTSDKNNDYILYHDGRDLQVKEYKNGNDVESFINSSDIENSLDSLDTTIKGLTSAIENLSTKEPDTSVPTVTGQSDYIPITLAFLELDYGNHGPCQKSFYIGVPLDTKIENYKPVILSYSRVRQSKSKTLEDSRTDEEHEMPAFSKRYWHKYATQISDKERWVFNVKFLNTSTPGYCDGVMAYYEIVPEGFSNKYYRERGFIDALNDDNFIFNGNYLWTRQKKHRGCIGIALFKNKKLSSNIEKFRIDGVVVNISGEFEHFYVPATFTQVNNRIFIKKISQQSPLTREKSRFVSQGNSGINKMSQNYTFQLPYADENNNWVSADVPFIKYTTKTPYMGYYSRDYLNYTDSNPEKFYTNSDNPLVATFDIYNPLLKWSDTSDAKISVWVDRDDDGGSNWFGHGINFDAGTFSLLVDSIGGRYENSEKNIYYYASSPYNLHECVGIAAQEVLLPEAPDDVQDYYSQRNLIPRPGVTTRVECQDKTCVIEAIQPEVIGSLNGSKIVVCGNANSSENLSYGLDLDNTTPEISLCVGSIKENTNYTPHFFEGEAISSVSLKSTSLTIKIDGLSLKINREVLQKIINRLS